MDVLKVFSNALYAFLILYMLEFGTFPIIDELKCGFTPPGDEISKKFIKETQVIFLIVKFSVLSYMPLKCL